MALELRDDLQLVNLCLVEEYLLVLFEESLKLVGSLVLNAVDHGVLDLDISAIERQESLVGPLQHLLLQVLRSLGVHRVKFVQ